MRGVELRSDSLIVRTRNPQPLLCPLQRPGGASIRSTSTRCRRSTAAPMRSSTICSRGTDEPASRLDHFVVAVVSPVAVVGQHADGAVAAVGLHAVLVAAAVLAAGELVRVVQRLQRVFDVRVRVVRRADLCRGLRHGQHRRRSRGPHAVVPVGAARAAAADFHRQVLRHVAAGAGTGDGGILLLLPVGGRRSGSRRTSCICRRFST